MKQYIKMLGIIFVTTICSIVLTKIGINKENALMLFMVGVLLTTALTDGYRFGVISSCISVMVFNYFFTEPLYTLAISDKNDIILIFFFLVVSVISSSLTARFRRQLMISKQNEKTVKLLYQISKRLLNITGKEQILTEGVQCIKEYTGLNSSIELNENKGNYIFNNNLSDIEKQSDIKTIELPIKGLVNRLGTLKVYAKNELIDDKQNSLLSTVAAQIGIALDREFAYNESANIRIAMEREHIKGNLLRSISHDLRTPLTGIAGASSYILQRGKYLAADDIENLAKDINEQAEWLKTLVENMLNMTRIENGTLEADKKVEVIDDIISEAVNHVNGLLERQFKINMPNELITASMDGKMIVQVLVNLLDNAVAHTYKNCPIELTVTKKDDYVQFKVEDGGPGIEENIRDDLFTAFVKSSKSKIDGKKGMGLGLAICKAIIQSHGGTISADCSALGGAAFKFTLPN